MKIFYVRCTFADEPFDVTCPWTGFDTDSVMEAAWIEYPDAVRIVVQEENQ